MQECDTTCSCSECHVTRNTMDSNNSSGVEIVNSMCLTNNNGANGLESENDTHEVSILWFFTSNLNKLQGNLKICTHISPFLIILSLLTHYACIRIYHYGVWLCACNVLLWVAVGEIKNVEFIGLHRTYRLEMYVRMCMYKGKISQMAVVTVNIDW